MATKRAPTSSRKVLIHALPPLLTREEFISQLPDSYLLQPNHTTIIPKNDPLRSKKCKLLLYVSGEISKARDIIDFSRAYVILETALAVKRFCEELHGTTFTTSNKMSNSTYAALKSTNAVVELAPVSRLPSKIMPERNNQRGKRRGRGRNNRGKAEEKKIPTEMALEINPFYLQFLKQEEAAKAKVVATSAVVPTSVAAATTASNSKSTKNGTWRRGANPTTTASKTTTAPPAPNTGSGTTGSLPVGVQPVSHLVQMMVAKRQKEEQEKRMRQNRMKRRNQSVRGLKKSKSGKTNRSGRSSNGNGRRNGGGGGGGDGKGKDGNRKKARKSRMKKKTGANGTYVPPPQRGKGGGGGGGGGGSGGGGSGGSTNSKNNKNRRSRNKSGGQKTSKSGDGWTTVNK